MIAWIAIFLFLLAGCVHDYMWDVKITKSFFAGVMGLFMFASVALTLLESI